VAKCRRINAAPRRSRRERGAATNLKGSSKVKTLFALTVIGAAFIVPVQAEPLAKTFTCQFGDLPPMVFQRPDPSNYTVRVGDALPVKLNVGSQFAIAEFQGQELIFSTQGQSV